MSKIIKHNSGVKKKNKCGPQITNDNCFISIDVITMQMSIQQQQKFKVLAVALPLY